MSIQQSILAVVRVNYSSEKHRNGIEGLAAIMIWGDGSQSEKQMGSLFHRITRFWVPTACHTLDSEVSKTRLCFQRVWNSVKGKYI